MPRWHNEAMLPWSRRLPAGVLAALLGKLLVQLYAAPRYGYFVDELYYLACSRHLDWGYVDQPPLIAVVVAAVRVLLGQSLVAIRLIPLCAGVLEVGLAALLACEMGGGAFAQSLAALGVLAAPAILGIDSFASMNALEPLFWMGCAWLLIRALRSGGARWWLALGALAGLGLENKHSMLIFGTGIVAGLLLTDARRELRSRGPWLAMGLALVIFLPNLLWNIAHHFPFLEIQANIRRNGRDVALGPLAFFGQEALTMNPLALPLWVGGLVFFFTVAGRRYRALGWAWIFTALTIITLSPRIYYLYPAFPLVFAAGAVFWEQRLTGKATWLRFAWPTLIVLSGALLAPLALPLFAPETLVRYTKMLGVEQPRIENHRLGPLPQIFADQFGWEDMAATVAGVYNALPPEVRARTVVFGQNYGQAGAIDLFGPKYGLPPAISGHQNYFLWGPRGYTGESMIVMDDNEPRLRELFTGVRKAAHVYHPYSMPYQHFDVYYCTGAKVPFTALWPRLKKWE